MTAMQQDRYGNTLASASPAARDSYVAGIDLMLSLQDGALPAFARAAAEDPGFALAHAALARAHQVSGDIPGAHAALAAAQQALAATDHRARSHVAVFAHLLHGRPAEALASVRAHAAEWPRDAPVVALAANQTGLIGMSGLPGREQLQLDFLATLAPHYDGDWWFEAHYGMALSELGRQHEAEPLIRRAIAANPRNAAAAHAHAHFLYETAAEQEAITYLQRFLPDYRGGLRGHLAWHLALVHLAEGDPAAGLALYDELFAPDDYLGPPMIRLMDAASFLWRAELAGHPRDEPRWHALHAWARHSFPNPGLAFVDWHVALADATVAPAAAEDRIAAIEAMVSAGRYPPGLTLPSAARGFAAFRRGDHPEAIAAIAPMLGERERLSGSRAQLDLLEFTLLVACLADGRIDQARHLLAARRPGPGSVPVAGAASLH